MKPTEVPNEDQNAKRVERLQIMVTDAELEALDNWRFNVRMPSRSAAVRELLRRGLAADGYFDQTNSKNVSAAFGVIDDKNGT